MSTADSEQGKTYRGGWAARWLVPTIYLACAAAFVSDLLRDDTLAFGIVYIPLIATAVLHRQRWGLWALTGISVVMVILGAFLPVVNPNLPDLIGNRVLSILAILTTAAFVHHARTIQERLTRETRRAEAAERIKADVLENLSREMRTPLHALTGLLSLIMADCSPAQREALGSVRAGGQQLLRTIDNLLDLTQIENRVLRPQVLDIIPVLGDAAEAIRAVPGDGQTAIVASPRFGRPLLVFADPWATRRILDNMIAEAIRGAAPGSLVGISVRPASSFVTVSVSSGATGMPSTPDEAIPDDPADAGAAELPQQIGAGLTLSHRLAQAMGAAMLLSDASGPGGVISLRLPVPPAADGAGDLPPAPG